MARKLPGRAIQAGSISATQLDNTVTTVISQGGGPKITNIQVTDNTYTVLDDTAVDTAGGYIRITGTGFAAGCQVLINNVPATSTTFVSATQVRAQVPATAAGTYVIYLVNTDGGVAIRVNGITFSATPTWVTGGALSGTNNVAISIQLSATLATTYALAAGSTLPTGLTLTSGGLLSGTISGLTQNTVYSFTVVATDSENQDSPRTFTLTITVADPYYELVTLHLPGNGTNGAQNNTFLDASTNNFTITRNGNTTQGTFSPFSQTGWGNYFSGSSQYLSFTDTSNNLDLGGSQASFECWVYPISTTNYQMLFKYGGTGDWNTTNGIEYGLSLQSGVVYFYYNSSASAANINSGATTVAANTWTHIAVASNASNALSLYVNGTRVATTTAAITKPTTRTSMRIGADISNYANGYMSNYRFITGSNAYDATLSSITVPTSPVSAVTGTQLLTCQSNRFVDNSTNNFTITSNGSPSVQAFSPFNPSASWSAATYGGSGYFDGNGDWLTIAEATPLQLNSTAFSIELWLYPSSVSANRMIIGKRDTNGGSGYAMSWYIQGNSNGGFIFYSANGSLTSNNNVLIANAWNHIAVTSDGTNVSMYANGSRVNTPTALAVGNSASSIYIGNFPVDNLYYQGNFADVRIQKGAQTYTGTTYTVPTAPLARDANTSLLLNFTNAGIYDATSKNDLETVGDARISTAQSRWGGSSMAFDGSGDYLTVPNGANNFVFGSTANYTFECWVYINSYTNYGCIFDTRNASVNLTAVLIRQNASAGTILVGRSSTVTSSSQIPTGQWVHLAVVRNSGTLTIYFNGSAVGSGSNSDNCTDTNCFIGGAIDGYYLNGYLQDLRVTKGIARYTANFTAPTAAFQTL